MADAHAWVARFRPADADVDAARVDTFTSTVFVATTCATPAVATAAGNIPEQTEEVETSFPVRPGDGGGNREADHGPPAR